MDFNVGFRYFHSTPWSQRASTRQCRPRTVSAHRLCVPTSGICYTSLTDFFERHPGLSDSCSTSTLGALGQAQVPNFMVEETSPLANKKPAKSCTANKKLRSSKFQDKICDV